MSTPSDKRIGITTTVPSEVLLAAGCQPVDLNNIFITDPDPGRLVNLAERAGFPQNCCTWIKGLYATCLEQEIGTVLGVTTGDCSNTSALLDVLRLRGVRVLTFAYPERPAEAEMERALSKLAAELGTSRATAERVRRELAPVRALAAELDTLTWHGNRASGLENHYWLVSTSDFNGDVPRFERELRALVVECRARPPRPAAELRLAYLGVPPVFASSLYRFAEEHGARMVFNEVQRQFSMPFEARSLAEQYTRYTYPYGIAERLGDILPELRRRGVEGVVHYVQAFCHRGILDIVLRESLGLPILTLEGNQDFALTAHLNTRLEAFLDVIAARRKR